MKYIVLLLMIGTMSEVALAQNLEATIKQEAQKCAKALVDNDYDAFIAHTHKRVVAGSGGKDAMIAELKRRTSAMRAKGGEITGVTIGEPEKSKIVGSWLISLVPEKIMMKVPGGRLQTDGTLLGISEDDGKSWSFIDVGVINEQQLAKTYPELRGSVTLPEKKEPIFYKDE